MADMRPLLPPPCHADATGGACASAAICTPRRRGARTSLERRSGAIHHRRKNFLSTHRCTHPREDPQRQPHCTQDLQKYREEIGSGTAAAALEQQRLQALGERNWMPAHSKWNGLRPWRRPRRHLRSRSTDRRRSTAFSDIVWLPSCSRRPGISSLPPPRSRSRAIRPWYI